MGGAIIGPLPGRRCRGTATLLWPAGHELRGRRKLPQLRKLLSDNEMRSVASESGVLAPSVR